MVRTAAIGLTIALTTPEPRASQIYAQQRAGAREVHRPGRICRWRATARRATIATRSAGIRSWFYSPNFRYRWRHQRFVAWPDSL